MFNIFSLKDFKLNKVRIALPKDEKKSQYGNLIILNSKDVPSCQKFIENDFINKMSVYNQIYRDMKFVFKVRGKSINLREARERLNDYRVYKEANGLHGIVTFNSNRGKNTYYDISRYNQLFFQATAKESHTLKYIDYFNIMCDHILNQEMVSYYDNKIMVINVEDWAIPNVSSNKETAYDNPLNIIFYAMRKDMDTFKRLGDIEILIVSSNSLFRFNPTRCDEKSYNDFKREVNKMERGLLADDKTALDPNERTPVKDLQQIDGKTVDNQLAKDPKVLNAIDNAENKPENNTDSKIDNTVSVENDPKVIDAIKSNVVEPVNIKSDAMSKRDEELREAQKNLRIEGMPGKLSELMEMKASQVSIPVNDVTDKVKTTNAHITKVKFPNFAEVYNDKLYHKDILSIADSMKDKSIPVYVRSVDRENTSDSLNLKETWTFNMEDSNRKRHTLKFDIPIFIDGRYMFLNGNKKEFNNQRFLKPLVKTGPDTVQVCANYNKIFMTRYGENVEAIYEKFKQMVVTDKKRFSYKKGNCSRVNAAYKTTIEYDTLAKSFAEITCKDDSGRKVIWKFVFNQDKLKNTCLNSPKLKDSYEKYTKAGMLVIGYNNETCIAIDPDTQILDVKNIAKENAIFESGVDIAVINRVKEIDNEIEALRNGNNEKRINELTLEKDRILAVDNNSHPGDIDKYIRNDDIKTMEEEEPVGESTSIRGDIRPLKKGDLSASYQPYDEKTGNYPYGYFVDGKCVGMIRATHTKGDKFYGLSWFRVDKPFRGQGIGKALLNFIIHKYGSNEMILNVALDNDRAISLYKKNGFKVTYKNDKPEKGDGYYVMTRKGKEVVDESYVPSIEFAGYNSAETDIEFVKESLSSAVKDDYNSFDELCQNISDPQDLLDWMYYHKVDWGDHNSNTPMHWPDDVVKNKSAICFDQAVFEYYWCKNRGIEAKMIHLYNGIIVRHGLEAVTMGSGHVMTMFRTDKGWRAFIYNSPKFNIEPTITKPMTEKKMIDFLHTYYKEALPRFISMNKKPGLSITTDKEAVIQVWGPKEYAVLDKMYGKTNITRNNIIYRFFPEDTNHSEYKRDVNIFDYMMAKCRNWITGKESYVPTMEAVDGSFDDDTSDDENGIVNYILTLYPNMDIKEFAKYKSGKRFMYTRCKVMKKNIPLIVFLSYCEGITTVLRKAEVKFMFSDKRPRLEGFDLVHKGVIQFADGYLIYDKFPLEKSLLMNGLSQVDTKNMEYADLDDKSSYLDIFDKMFGSRMIANPLDNFYEWMIDAPTKQILEDLNYPTDFVGLLLAGNKLLADNNYRDEIDMANWRIRNNELVYAYAYKRIADAYTKYRMTSQNKNPVKISIPKDAVLKDIMMSQIVEDVAELSPIVDVEKSHAVTDKGPSGTNLEQAYTQERRCFHPSMKGVMAISTSPDANVGLMRELTLEPNITNARGYVTPSKDSKLDEVNLFSAAELLTPLGVTRDDPIRTAMASKQSKHLLPVESASPVLMSNGAERVLPYHISSDFTIVAKEDGEVLENDEETGVAIIRYKDSGDTQVINTKTKVVKNGAGGFYLPTKLDCSKLKKGRKFKKNDILAYNTRFFSDTKNYGTRFNIGTLVKIACMSSYANFEDGDCATKKLSEKLGTEICMAVDAVVGANSNVESIVKIGQQVKVGDPLIVYDQSSNDASFNKLLANIGEDLKEEITGMGKTPVKAKYSGVIQDIKMYATVDTDEMSPSLKKIVDGYYSKIRARKRLINKYRKGDTTTDYSFTEQDKKIETTDGKIMGTTVGEGVKIVFYIKYRDNLDVGDKLVHFAALKCVNGEMIPEGQEPFAVGSPDEEISTTFAPGAVLSRMVPSVMQTMFGNKIIIQMKRHWLELYKKDNPNFKPKDDLY